MEVSFHCGGWRLPAPHWLVDVKLLFNAQKKGPPPESFSGGGPLWIPDARSGPANTLLCCRYFIARDGQVQQNFLGHLSMGQRNARPRALIARRQPHFRQRPLRRYSQVSQVSSRWRYCSASTVRHPSATNAASDRARFQACLLSGGGLWDCRSIVLSSF